MKFMTVFYVIHNYSEPPPRIRKKMTIIYMLKKSFFCSCEGAVTNVTALCQIYIFEARKQVFTSNMYIWQGVLNSYYNTF